VVVWGDDSGPKSTVGAVETSDAPCGGGAGLPQPATVRTHVNRPANNNEEAANARRMSIMIQPPLARAASWRSEPACGFSVDSGTLIIGLIEVLLSMKRS
jgi:hypothetical protein